MEKHRCKICSKCFPCGRSLGGHMRSHMRFCSSVKEKEKLENSSYVLRENPKKTGMLLDFAGEDPTSSSSSLKTKQCKVCGKEFPSWKALFGHMRCHSNKICRRSFEAEKQEEDQEEEEEVSWKHRSMLTSAASSITEYEQEQEEVAISLMMLSRDVGGYWSIAADSSDKQSEVMEDDGLIKRSEEFGGFDLEYSGEESGKQKIMTLAEFGKKRARIAEKGSELNAHEAKLGIIEIKLESRYQCAACKKGFHSYQALGGHRASHKRIRGCCFQNPNANFDDKTEAYVEHLTVVEMEHSYSGLSKKSRIHECSICGKIFSSGQALGGHKRSHLVSTADASSCGDNAAAVAVTAAAVAVTVAAAVEVPELLDLNLPAPVDDESSNVKPWWSGESIEHEQNSINLIDF
ncbi:zinc finger protein ZAT1-like [Dendrobium catenatum]|uniref:Zinc finger protein ZAT4 n=1 Tax=Dendrobium catenatum TaxID=906689 RepID=A0A2I0WV28_9ASPA|nr:zinc finger protein ZAT1-like [Dendrobium catenatum]PKU79512.1 Zinc finger protein ZAT4 [Dendrobium catenatum]